MKTLRIIFILVFLSVCNLNMFSQGKQTDNDTTVYIIADKYPVLISDKNTYEIDKIQDFITENLKYPNTGPYCVGSVFISITIEKDGSVSRKEFVRKLCPDYDENAMRVVNYMASWKPALKNGKPVRYKITLPIKWI